MVKILTYLWCVNKSNLESRRDEGPGDEDDDGKRNPAWTQRQTHCRLLFKCDKMLPEDQTHLSMQAYRGKIKRENMKKHSAMLFFLPRWSTARRTTKSPATNMQKQTRQSTNKSTPPSGSNNTFVTSPSCGCVPQTPGEVTDQHGLLSVCFQSVLSPHFTPGNNKYLFTNVFKNIATARLDVFLPNYFHNAT